jgi:hypothetical protein
MWGGGIVTLSMTPARQSPSSSKMKAATTNI